MPNNVIDEPIIIKGGSLKIQTQRRLLEVTPGQGEYRYPVDNGRMTAVDIDGTLYSVNPRSKIVIHYEVPHTP